MRNAQAVSRRALIASFAAASIGLVGSRAIQAQSESSSVQMDAVAVVERVRSSVVTVVNEQVGQNPFRSSTMPQEAGRGTGFIIDEQGHIVTNEHVVRSGDAFEVILANGERRQAQLV
jgi:S1-C subfamily serine protease